MSLLSKESRRLYLAFYTPITPFNFFLNGLLLLFLGLWIGAPFWEAFDGANSFRVMDGLLPEWLWATIISSVGLVKLWAARTVNVGWMRFAAITGFTIWSIMAVSVWVSNWHSPACIILSYFVVQSAWHYLNLSIMGFNE